MSNTFKLLSFLTFTLVFSACTSGPSGPAKNEFCKAGVDPLSMEPGKTQKKLEISNGKIQLKNGDYKYAQGNYFYHDYDRDLTLMISNKVGDDGAEKFNIECIGGNGFGRTMDEVSSKIEVITGMKVAADGTALVSTKVLTFRVAPNLPAKDMFGTEPGETDTTLLISEVYANEGNVTQAVFDLNAGKIEARAKISDTPEVKDKKKSTGIEQWTNVALTFVDPNAPAKDTKITK